jgi:hypothetical protein
MAFEKRLSNWPRLLNDFVESRRHTPFAWGKNDCCTFAADAVVAIYGADPMQHLRDLYDDATGALAIIGGADDLPEYACRVLVAAGFREIEPIFAGRGDVVCVKLERPTCGVHLGSVIAAPSVAGLAFLPLNEVLKAWRAE